MAETLRFFAGAMLLLFAALVLLTSTATITMILKFTGSTGSTMAWMLPFGRAYRVGVR